MSQSVQTQEMADMPKPDVDRLWQFIKERLCSSFHSKSPIPALRETTDEFFTMHTSLEARSKSGSLFY